MTRKPSNGPSNTQASSAPRKWPLVPPAIGKFSSWAAKMNAAVMNLYKEYGANPASGCLPMLLQMPILFALYAVFRSSIELRQSAFVWWITDLSIPDAVLHLPFTIPMVDDHHFPRVRTVGIGDVAALNQRDAHGLEIAWGRDVPAGYRRVLARRQGAAGDPDDAGVVVAAERQIRRRANVAHPGNCGQPLKQVREEILRAGVIPVANPRQGNLGRDHIFRLESRVHAKQPRKAHGEQPRADEQHEGEGELAYYQCRTDPDGAARRGSRALAAAEYRVQIPAQHVDQRHAAEHHAGEKSDCGGEDQRAGIDGDGRASRQIFRAQVGEQAHAAVGHGDSERASHQRQGHAFGEQLPGEPPTAGP